MVSLADRIKKIDEENTELNLDGLQKPDLSLLKEKADIITELSLNACKINNLSSLPTMPGLYKLQLNDNSLTDISELAAKCPGLMELSVSGNKKIASVDQLKPLAQLKTLLKIELEGCDIAEEEEYRKPVFAAIATLANVDGFDKRGVEIPDDDDEDEEEEDESEEEVSAGVSGTLASLYNADLPSEDDEDGDYDSNEEPEGSDGDDDEDSQDEIIQPTEGNDEGAGSSGDKIKSRIKPKKEQKQSSLFSALCDQNRRYEPEKETDADDDWRQFLADPTFRDPPSQARSQLTSHTSPRECYSQQWSSNRWSTRTSGCSSLHSSEYAIDFDGIHLDDHSSFDDSNSGFILCDTPEGSITTHPDYLDTYSENGGRNQRHYRMPNRPSYHSADTLSDIVPRSVRPSLPYNPYSRARVRTSTLHSTPSLSCPCPSEPVIPEQPQVQPAQAQNSLRNSSKIHEKWHQLSDEERKKYLEDLIQSLSINDQLHIIRMIAPATDLQQSDFQQTTSNQPQTSHHQPHPVQSSETWNLQLKSCDAGKISEVEQYVAQCNVPQGYMPSTTQYPQQQQVPVQMAPNQTYSHDTMSYTNLQQPMHNCTSHQQPPLNHQNSCPSVSQQFSVPAPPQPMAQLRRSNSDPNLADQIRHIQAKKKREDKQKQRHIYRWLNSQTTLRDRRKRKLLQERSLPQLFSQQEVVEVTSDPTIDEQNEEIDVCE
ncbi:Oidioi.mRNA.OKI2018_I69.chr1.g2342.t1.cds [Oikopleura dioica]|uniref:Oidioi.mRNA.OKI2018_I69.chr1.g2342.t1.cds n=1 Tax=Oikopleura dioica TaxID=34765 RepID=A0ABN7SUC3_OIKDI|nr:Oidioi.mRNA.OKI2018_I69.chr1.g2342.t1.cds [Oikopleura dioica]